MIKFLIIFICTFLTIITISSSDLIFISETNFVFLSVIIFLDYFNRKSLSYLQVWLLAFIFIILSESLIIDNQGLILRAAKYLFISNIIVVIGYHLPFKINMLGFKLKNYSKKKSKWTPYVLILIIFIYVLYSIPSAILTYNLGRNTAANLIMEDRNIIYSNLFQSLGLILPSIIMFYFKEVKNYKTIYIPLIICLPIFTILFISGTRFNLLFSLGGFIFLSQISRQGKIKLGLKLLVLSFVLLISSLLMFEFRSDGLSKFNKSIEEVPLEKRFSQKIAAKMSPEGIIDMTALSMNYFDNNPHTYGKSTAFLTYFWIPRSLWKDKPTMIGHWLIRTSRSGFSEGHSASFGFTGELYADFGYFSFLFLVLIGIILKWGDRIRDHILQQEVNYYKILVAMVFPYVFFFVRSPITASITFIGIVLIHRLIRVIIFK